MAKLVWNSTGDEIPLVARDVELFGYYIDQLQRRALNQFRYTPLNFESKIDEIKSSIEFVVSVLENKMKVSMHSWTHANFLDQKDLNSIHREWVQLHLKYPNFVQLFEKHYPELGSKVNRINKLIHWLEEAFDNIRLTTVDTNQNFENIFGSKILSFHVGNILISYNNLGRSTYNKWLNFDDNLGNDTNDFKSLYTTLKIRISRPVSYQAPPEYVDWCKKNNTLPMGSHVTLANFDNIEENLLLYRQLFYRNQTLDNNFIILKE